MGGLSRGRQAGRSPPGLAVREGAGLVLGTLSLSPWLLLCGFWPPGAWSSQSCKSWAARVGLQRGTQGPEEPGAGGALPAVPGAWQGPSFIETPRSGKFLWLQEWRRCPGDPEGRWACRRGGTRGQQGHPCPQGLGPELTTGTRGRDVGRPLPRTGPPRSWGSDLPHEACSSPTQGGPSVSRLLKWQP